MNTITLRPDIYKGAELYARKHNVSIDKFVENIIEKALSLNNSNSEGKGTDWRKYDVSPEVMDMTFEDRKDIVADYREEYVKHLEKKYK